MKIDKSLIYSLIVLVVGGASTFFWYSFNTIQDNKERTIIVNEGFTNISEKLDEFVLLQRDNNKNLNRRIDAISDSLSIQHFNNDNSHKELFRSINQIIYIEKKTNKEFKNMFNNINLTAK